MSKLEFFVVFGGIFAATSLTTYLSNLAPLVQYFLNMGITLGSMQVYRLAEEIKQSLNELKRLQATNSESFNAKFNILANRIELIRNQINQRNAPAAPIAPAAPARPVIAAQNILQRPLVPQAGAAVAVEQAGLNSIPPRVLLMRGIPLAALPAAGGQVPERQPLIRGVNRQVRVTSVTIERRQAQPQQDDAPAPATPAPRRQSARINKPNVSHS